MEKRLSKMEFHVVREGGETKVQRDSHEVKTRAYAPGISGINWLSGPGQPLPEDGEAFR